MDHGLVCERPRQLVYIIMHPEHAPQPLVHITLFPSAHNLDQSPHRDATRVYGVIRPRRTTL